MRTTKLQPLIETAILAALAFIIDLLPSIKLGPWISISFAMVPVFILSFRWGLKYGLMSGFLWGLLQVIFGDAYILHWFQFIVEYFVAFAFVGFAGIFMRQIQENFAKGNKGKVFMYVTLATFVGSFARYLIHYIAGIVFWGSYAPEGQPVWMYSLVVNGPAGLGSFLFCLIVLILLISVSPRILTESRKKSNFIPIK